MKDTPLLLRRRATIDEEGEKSPAGLELSSDAWPERHEFSNTFLIMTPEVEVRNGEVTLQLTNARARYKIVETVEIDGEDRRSYDGVWGELIEGSVD